MAKKCPNCGAKNRGTDHTCTTCGEPLDEGQKRLIPVEDE